MNKEELKAEAVNDIKLINDAVDSEEDLPFLHRPNSDESDAIISYLMWKNNLTQEDLKDIYYLGVDYAKGEDKSVVNGEFVGEGLK